MAVAKKIQGVTGGSTLPNKYIGQIVNGFQGPRDKSPRAPGPAFCRAVEAAYNLPPGWMEMEHTGTLIDMESDWGVETAVAAPEERRKKERRAMSPEDPAGLIRRLGVMIGGLPASRRRSIGALLAEYAENPDPEGDAGDAVISLLSSAHRKRHSA